MQLCTAVCCSILSKKVFVCCSFLDCAVANGAAVCLSVRLSHFWSTPTRFKISKRILHLRSSNVSSFQRLHFLTVNDLERHNDLYCALFRQPDVSRNALSFNDEFFYRNTFLSSRGEAGQQMYTRGSDIGEATRIEPDISPTPSLIFTGGQKVRILALSLPNARLWAAVVWKPSKISSPSSPCATSPCR